MKLSTTIIPHLLAGIPALIEAATPYTCVANHAVSYEAGVLLQSIMVNKVAALGAQGTDLNPLCISGYDVANAGDWASIACVVTKKKTITTAGQVQSALGQILSGCVSRGLGGTITLNNVQYGIYGRIET